MLADQSEDLSLRQRIEAEQGGEGRARSDRFERGVSIAATMLARFGEERAEIKLVIDGVDAEGGFGTRHLYNCLKRLAGIDANFLEVDKALVQWKIPESLEGGLDETHNFLVTSLDYVPPPEFSEKVRVIRY